MSATQEDLKSVHEVSATPKPSFFKRIVSNITVEPVVICWLLPFLLTYSSIENLNFEKACRGFVQDAKEFNPDICKVFVRQAQFSIACDAVPNNTDISSVDRVAIERKYPDVYKSIENKFEAAIFMICETEGRVQEKMSDINSIRNPVAAIGPLIIILFAGPWSDKKNRRIPCMLVPFLGEAIGYLSSLSRQITHFLN